VANFVGVTNRGFEYLCNYLNGANPGSTVFPQPNVIGWGTANGSNATSVTEPAASNQWNDIAPFFELGESRTSGSGSVIVAVAQSYGTYQLTGTITATSAENVGESFIAMSTTKPAATSVATSTVTPAATSFTCASNPFPAAPFYVQVDNEVILVNSTSASNILNVSRAQNGSVAGTHNTNAGVTLGNPMSSTSSNPNHGDMFAHAGFTALALNINDSIAFTWQVTVTY
jgi:hypothetical protein